jgi:hypothetical protein
MGKKLKKVKEVEPIVWLKGLAAAVIGGAVGGASQAIEEGSLDPVRIRNGAIAGAALLVTGYFLKSPFLPAK